MGILDSIKSFFTVEEQKKRLTNVIETVKSAVTLQGVSANTGNKAVDTVLSKAASNPYATAAVAATVINPSSALAAVKTAASAVGSAVTKAFSSLNPLQKVAVVAATPVAASVVVTSKSAQQAILNAPSSLVNFGANIGKAIDNPSLKSVANIAKENPLLTTAVVGGATIAAATGVTGLVSNYLTAANTRAMVTNTQQTLANTKATQQNTIGTVEDVSSPEVVAPSKLMSTSDIITSAAGDTTPSSVSIIPAAVVPTAKKKKAAAKKKKSKKKATKKKKTAKKKTTKKKKTAKKRKVYKKKKSKSKKR